MREFTRTFCKLLLLLIFQAHFSAQAMRPGSQAAEALTETIMHILSSPHGKVHA